MATKQNGGAPDSASNQQEPEKAIIVREVYHQGDLARLQTDLEKYAEKFNLLSSVQSIEWIPDFMSVSAVRVPVDTRTVMDGGEVYEMGWAADPKDKRFILAKQAVDRLAMAAGAEVVGTARTDDRSDPLYCEFVAHVLVPDVSTGKSKKQSRTAEIDLRDGSKLCEKLIHEAEKAYERKLAKAKEQNWKRMPEKPDTTARIREMAATIVRRCETAAILRALKSGLGCGKNYTGEDLRKPFLVLRLIETGRCDDPRMQQAYRQMALARMAGACDALFGYSGRRESNVITATAIPVDDTKHRSSAPTDEQIAEFEDGPEPGSQDPDGPDGVPAEDPFGNRR